MLRRLARIVEQLCPHHVVRLPRWAEDGDTPDTAMPVDYAPREPMDYPPIALPPEFRSSSVVSAAEIAALRYLYRNRLLSWQHYLVAELMGSFGRYLRAMSEVAELRAVVLGDPDSGRSSAFERAAETLARTDPVAIRLRELDRSADARHAIMSEPNLPRSAPPAFVARFASPPSLPHRPEPPPMRLTASDLIDWSEPIPLDYSARRAA